MQIRDYSDGRAGTIAGCADGELNIVVSMSSDRRLWRRDRSGGLLYREDIPRRADTLVQG